jgi:hypothetical protein
VFQQALTGNLKKEKNHGIEENHQKAEEGQESATNKNPDVQHRHGRRELTRPRLCITARRV